jgi:hypothetical protein
MRILLLISLFLLIQHISKCNDPYILGIRSHYGFIIPHSASIRQISDVNPWGIGIDGSKLFTGEKAWDYCFCYPRIGMSINYFNFNNPSVIGQGLISALYVEPFLSYHRKMLFSYRFGLGLVYLNKPYDPVTNPQNLFYSTHLSFTVYLKATVHYRVNDQYTLRLSGNYNHISNGGIKLPNKGINYPTISMGVDYHFHIPEIKKREKTKKALYEDTWWWNTTLFFTLKNKSRIDTEDDIYPVYGAAVTYNYLFARKNAVFTGVEFESNRALRKKLREKDINTDHRKGALLVGHQLLVGRFSFNQYFGFYFYSPHKPLHVIYQRYELTFNITDKVFTGINLKAHWESADFLDVRFGIKL